MSTMDASRYLWLTQSDGMRVRLVAGLLSPTTPKTRLQDDEGFLHGGPFVQEPPWPDFVASNDLVFAPDWMQGSRAHFLFPKEVLSPEIAEVVKNDKIREKVEEWLNFDIASAYPEYQGSISLVAPNPLYRTIETSHLEQPLPGFAESVAYKVVVRDGQRLNGLASGSCQ